MKNTAVDRSASRPSRGRQRSAPDYTHSVPHSVFPQLIHLVMAQEAGR